MSNHSEWLWHSRLHSYSLGSKQKASFYRCEYKTREDLRLSKGQSAIIRTELIVLESTQLSRLDKYFSFCLGFITKIKCSKPFITLKKGSLQQINNRLKTPLFCRCYQSLKALLTERKSYKYCIKEFKIQRLCYTNTSAEWRTTGNREPLLWAQSNHKKT